MNPSPAEQWLRDYCVRVCGSLPDQPLPVYLLHNPAELGRQRLNPVERPDGVRFPLWFDSLETPTGQLLGSRLGVQSGFFQEYLNWAPSVSWFYDLTARLCQLCVHPHTPSAFRDALFPFVFGYAEILEQAVALLQIHAVHAQHHGTALDGAWRALQTQVRLQATTNRFCAEIITDTLDRINKELLSQQLKQATKTEAHRQSSTRSDGPKQRPTQRPPKQPPPPKREHRE